MFLTLVLSLPETSWGPVKPFMNLRLSENDKRDDKYLLFYTAKIHISFLCGNT